MTPPVGRRLFLTSSLAAGAVLVVGCTPEQLPPPHAGPPAPTPHGRAPMPPEQPFSANAWVRIAPDETVTVVIDKSEMGQGVETSLAMLAADELDADWSKVKIEFAPVADEYRNRIFHSQGTGGSTSIRSSYMPMRVAGAGAREVLVAAAAAMWGVEPASCRTENGAVLHPPTGKRASYGTLTERAAAIPAPAEPKLKAPADFKLIGKPITRLDAAPKAAGKVEFGVDVRRPGMLVATVARCPVLGGKPSKWDEAAALAVKGVKKVLAVSGGIAVVAEHFWAAKKGAEALAITWDEGPNVTLSSESIAKAAADLARKPGAVAEARGDVEKALKGAAKRLEAVYELPFQAHATMEPMNCTAEVRADGCDIWVGTQSQESTRNIAAQITGLAPATINVHTVYLGGGFGRRAEKDFVIDAVEIAKAMPGVPVKVIWPREEDMRHDYYRPAARVALRGGVGKDGKPAAVSYRIVSGSIRSRFAPGSVKGGIDPSSVEGATEQPYDVPSWRVEYHLHDAGVPVGFWRSVGHSGNAFATEGFLDELCAAAKRDPVEMRRALLTDARLRAVLDLAAEKAGWGKPMEKGRGRGVACHFSFGTRVAEVAEVTVAAGGKVRVDRVVCALDCGVVVNPDTIQAQVQGAIVYGLTATLKSAITLAGGKVVQTNFHNFKLLPIDEMPVIEVHVVPSAEPPGGIGEPATPPIAPAVVNAIFAATGKRLRRLPIQPSDLEKA